MAFSSACFASSAHGSASAFAWASSTSAGVIEAANVVAATGPFQRPIIPAVVPADAGIVQLHSNAYRNPAQLPEGAVLVIGAGSSGAQIADELLRVSAEALPGPANDSVQDQVRKIQDSAPVGVLSLSAVVLLWSASSLFVVKDPRISKLLPLWIELLAEIDVDLVVVMAFRNPLEVAESLAKRDLMPLASSLLLYFTSYLKS